MRNSFIRNFIAISLIGMGTMLVLDNLGVIESDFKEAWHYIYPIFFIVLGITVFYGFLKSGGEGWIFGSFFVIFGILLLLGRMGIIDYVFSDLLKLWPLLIIYIGFSLIGKASSRRKKPRVHIFKDGDYYKGNYKGRFVVGNFEYKQPNWKVEPIELRNMAGDYYFDFTKAFIPEEEIPIIIDSWAGDVQMLLPESLEFRIKAYVKAGEINLLGEVADGINRHQSYETPGYHEAVRKLDIIVDLKAGSVRVDKV